MTTLDRAPTTGAGDEDALPEPAEDTAYVPNPELLEETWELYALRYLERAGSTMEGMHDLLWALVNMKEFIVNH